MRLSGSKTRPIKGLGPGFSSIKTENALTGHVFTCAAYGQCPTLSQWRTDFRQTVRAKTH